ncbi:hypothetical protein BU24DRAFT_377715, partial [Aaosphaeria arxii CBS 175.79]
MASAKQQENMLLTEHFTWSPISLLDDIINAANEVLYKCTDTFESGLLSADASVLGFTPSTSHSSSSDDLEQRKRLEIEEGVLKLETLLENALDRNLDRLEIWTLRNVLCVPGEVREWVRLKGYENITTPPSNNTTTPESLHALRRKLLETQRLHAALTAEKTRNDALISQLRSLLTPSTSTSLPTSTSTSESIPGAQFGFLTHAPAAQSLGITTNENGTEKEAEVLRTHTTFTASHLPHLHALLTSLRPYLPSTSLPLPSSSSEGATGDERRVYIESQSKRVLERRGVDTRDGVEGVVGG